MTLVIRERTMDTARGRTAWLEAGAGWPVILLHAFPLNADMWRPQFQRLPTGWRFLAPDLRGFGQSAPVDKDVKGGSYGVDDYAADVFALMDCLELDDAVIGGLSMGGYVTFAMYRQAPARFTGMILADTRSPADPPPAREARLQLRRLLAEQGPAGVANAMLPKLLGADADQGAIDFARDLIESAPADAIDAAIGAMMERPDSTPDLARITCATLVAVGEHDTVTPVSESEAMQGAIRRSRLTVIPGAGHLSNLEQPAAFSRALEDFLLSAL